MCQSQVYVYQIQFKHLTQQEAVYIQIGALDSNRGNKADMIITDFTQTSQLGFIADPYQTCLALTRSVQCEVMIMKRGMWLVPAVSQYRPQVVCNQTEQDL